MRLIAEGDSWFQFPILLKDIIDCLSDEFAIHCSSAAGDTVQDMTAGVEDLERLTEEYQAHGLLFSGGGNDIAGEALVSYLLPFQPSRVTVADFVSPAFWRFLGKLARKLTVFFNRLARRHPDLPIFCHGYDWPIPQNSGRWLHPAMEQLAIPSQFQAPTLKLMIIAYYDILFRVAANASARVIIIDCRGIVCERAEWFDELHPYNNGYARIADKFREAIHREIDPANASSSMRSITPTARVIKAPAIPLAPSALSARQPASGATDALSPVLGQLVDAASDIEPTHIVDRPQELRYLEIELISGNIVNIASPAYVVGIFEHVEPSGAIKEIDELLGHRLSSLIHAGLFGSELGKSAFFPLLNKD